MKRILYHSLGLFLCLSAFSFTLNAQEENMPENKPVKNTFNSIWIYNNPSVMVPIVGTFEMDFQHRFGTINNGIEDLFGIYAPFADVRLGFEYVPVKKLMVGFGINRTGLTWDLNAKYAIFQQMQSGGSPVSLTYYVNAGIRTEDKIKFPVPDQVEFADRVSYYHTL
ncbi:MAG TPA: DUF5777 family beta-barrel protein, partial [Saprospiraceae bacterium]|nr:DUF5777 family beta-barrel protein [Saprospiraceae bacterium]